MVLRCKTPVLRYELSRDGVGIRRCPPHLTMARASGDAAHLEMAERVSGRAASADARAVVRRARLRRRARLEMAAASPDGGVALRCARLEMRGADLRHVPSHGAGVVSRYAHLRMHGLLLEMIGTSRDGGVASQDAAASRDDSRICRQPLAS